MIHHTQHTCKQRAQYGSNIHGLNNPLRRTYNLHKAEFFYQLSFQERQTCLCERHKGILNPRKWMEFRGQVHATADLPPEEKVHGTHLTRR
jgi:hypothetical protein